MVTTPTTCPACSIARTLAEAAGATMQCRGCLTLWVIDGAAAADDATDLDAGDSPPPATLTPTPDAERPSPPLDRKRPPFRLAAPARDIALLARWLPELLARSPALVRNTGTPGHSGSSASSHSGRLDYIDDSQGYRRAVEVLRYLRAAIAAGQGETVAILWTGYALAQGTDATDLDVAAARELAARVAAVALGAAPTALRETWRQRAAETDRTRTVESPLTLTTVTMVEGGGAMQRVFAHREVVRTHKAILSTKGPSLEALAAAWGTEKLAPLWAPGPVPVTLALGVAMGFAPEVIRAQWARMKSALRDGSARAWGEATLRERGDSLRNSDPAKENACGA
jgi:hypothetical protein